MILIASLIILLLNSAVDIIFAVQKKIDAVKESDLTAIAITNGTIYNSTYLGINVTIIFGDFIPKLTDCDVIVWYIDNTTGTKNTHILMYGQLPGWDVRRIIVGSSEFYVNEHNFLLPGEVAELNVYLPSDASLNYPITVVFATSKGASAAYNLG
jgi:hypothetical protein